MGCKGAWFLLVAAVSLTCVSGDTLLLESQILNQTDESTINSLTNTAGLVSNTHLSHLKNIETKEIRPKTTNLIEKITSIASSQISTGFPDSLIPTPSYPFCTTGPGCNVFQRPSSTSPTSGVEMRVTDEVASTFLELETQNSHTSISIDHQVPTNISVSKNSSNITNEDIDECRFMSFEEWKRQKQEEAAAESVSASSASAASSADLLSSHTLAKVNTSTVDTTYSSPSNIAQEEDQGRVYKKKFNYASSDCAATIMKANSEAKGALAILHENKDSYLLNQCSSSNKYVIIELCQDILVSEVVMGNFEFFSSMFKDIRISVSDQFPATKWEVLGEFEAENVRDLQVFTVKNPLIWARYLKLEIVSHYGNEFYCPISVVRVHGKTMMEEFKEEQKGVDQVPSMNITIATDVANITTQNLNNYSTRDDECRVILPHLLLHEFLQDINGTDQYCAAVAVDREVKTIETTATTQESIYKNIMKRLSLLESNATLSLLYIEEQSKLLSTAFTNLERRQTSTFNDLVQSFNITMLSQVKIMKEAYERIQKEATMLLQNQENRYRGGLSDANYKLGMLANDLRFHKRIIIFNTLIIICLLVYVVLTRDTAIGDYITKEKRSQRWGQFTSFSLVCSPSANSPKLSSATNTMRAILLGSTGLVGSLALKILSECKEIDSIFTVSRRAPKVEGSKIDSVIEKDSDVWGDIIRKQKDNDVFISAFGTTKKLAGGNEGFLKIDYGINYDAAKAAKDAGVKTFVLVSSGAASSLSPFFYLKTKGKLEDDIVALKFPRTIIIRPGVLLGEREASHGFFESSLVKVALLVKNSVFAFPLYPAYDEEVAKAAIFTALEPLKSTEPEVVIVLGTEVNKTAKEYDAKYSGST